MSDHGIAESIHPDACTVAKKDACTVAKKDVCTAVSQDVCTVAKKDACPVAKKDACTVAKKDACTAVKKDVRAADKEDFAVMAQKKKKEPPEYVDVEDSLQEAIVEMLIATKAQARVRTVQGQPVMAAGEHLSDGELKAIIFAKMSANTAASLRQEQSSEKVKAWWTEVTGFPKGSGHFQVRYALKRCSLTNVSKCKEKDSACRFRFAEKQDRDIFNEVINGGVSFGRTRLVAKPWVFSFTPTELWEALEKLADANHQQFHEGLSRNPPSKGGNAKNVNYTQSKNCAICLSFGHTNRAHSHSTENHMWNNTDADSMAQEGSKDPPKAPVKKVDENRQSTPSEKDKGSKGQQTSGGKGSEGQSSQGLAPEILKNGNGNSNSAKGNGGKGNFSKGKGQSSGQFSGYFKGMSAGKGKGTSQGTNWFGY